MAEITRAFIEKLPKNDLHLHLDGSLRISTLIELAKDHGVELPSYTESGLRETVFKDNYADLNEYLAGFAYTTAVMQTPEQLERIAFEVAEDNQKEGVRYIEVRFAPQLHASDEMDIIGCLRAVDNGLAKAKASFNSQKSVVDGSEPPFDYAIIACAMRFFLPQFSAWYRNFSDMHKYSDVERLFGLASIELESAVRTARFEEGLPVVGIDLAGAEAGWPAIDHKVAFRRAQRNFLKKTVHAGEAFGPESINQAITELYADRIGHGLTLLNSKAITSEDIKEPEKYVETLVQYIADRRITIEVCLTSNQQTDPKYRDLNKHPFREMMNRKLSIAICTDNRTISNTTVTDELYKAVTTFNLSLYELKSLIVYGFKRSFFPGRYDEKRKYVRRCMDYFDKVLKEN